MMTGKNNTVLYTEVTRDLKKRAYEHRNKMVEGFTKRYNLTKLVYYIDFVNGFNPSWADLYDRI